ncbi:phage major capsid protein [Rhizobium mongolense]|uniref:HK97 family phage major capsid protein n=1 Tax=Rhizobium mongolense TaxID=57676 RepID=A0A7W6WBZ9_9HYPH|nr:phage major capsid protein [Rhizobium mongolense]MBB4272782.1 HK97 family phage major capsid protein [Rhizobium mongolense]
MSLKDLNEKRGKLVHDAREALDAIKANTDEARAAELDARHDTIMAEFDKIEKQIEREERTAAIEARFEQRRAQQRPISADGEQRGQDEGDKLDYRHVFAKVVCGGIDDLSAEERAVLKQGVAKFEQRTQTAGTTTAGGFTVPTELANEIVRSMLAWGPMYDEDVARVITSSAGNPMKVPTVNDTSKSAGAHTEGTALTDDGSEDATFGQKSLDAYVFDTEFIRWSFELDSDSIFSMEALLADLLGERLGRVANAQLTLGTGSSAPNGVVTASTLGKTAASATALTCDELIDLEHSVNRAYRKSPKTAFMMNDLTVKAVRKLKNSDGDYIWSAGDVTQGRPATLLGYKLNVNDSMADIATGQKTVLFGDFNKYFVRKVGSPVIGVLRERFWPDLGIAGLIRFDGELADTAAIKHLIQA